MGDCGRHVPTHYEVEGRADYLSNYPESLADYGFGEMHDVKFPYHEVCEAIAACRDIAVMLRADLETRGDALERGGPSGCMVAEATKDWAGGFRKEFDGAWATQKQALADCELNLDDLAGALEEAWDGVIAEDTLRADNRAAYDSWLEQTQASSPD